MGSAGRNRLPPERENLRLIAMISRKSDFGDYSFKRKGYYYNTHYSDLRIDLNVLRGTDGGVMILWYGHGKSKIGIDNVLKEYPTLSVLRKNRYNIYIISRDDDFVANDLVRKVIKEEKWKELW